MPAEDPMGKRGLTLEQFLRVNALDTRAGHCPYGRKCTYGTKCKYIHTDRQNSANAPRAPVRNRSQREKEREEFM